MKRRILHIFSLVLVTTGIWSCEDVIDLEVKDGVTQLVVDAWLTDKDEVQRIKLSLSQGYFDNSPVREALGAEVLVFEEDSTVHAFLDINNDGVYVLQGENFLQQGGRYSLYVAYEGEAYGSITQKKRVPVIDSLVFEKFTFPIAQPNDEPQSGFFAQFYARDFDGEGDTYWIRYKKNDTLRNAPGDLNIAYDASFSPGAGSDGLTFIQPIRSSINDGLYLHGDKVDVELWSISNEAYLYLFQIRQESANGGIFAVPPANIPTNIVNLDINSETKALGFFGVSSVSKATAVADSTTARPE